MIFASLLCRFLGHKERRLRANEFGTTLREALYNKFDGINDKSAHRICDRCGRLRAVKARKKGAV